MIYSTFIIIVNEANNTYLAGWKALKPNRAIFYIVILVCVQKCW